MPEKSLELKNEVFNEETNEEENDGSNVESYEQLDELYEKELPQT